MIQNAINLTQMIANLEVLAWHREGSTMTSIVRNLISESVEWKRLSKITGKELSAVFRAAEKDVDECKSERQEKQRLITRLRDHTHLTQLTLTTMTRELTLSSHRPTQPATVTNECNFNDEICCFCKFSDLNYILVCRQPPPEQRGGTVLAAWRL